jgi:hypothetical protein
MKIGAPGPNLSVHGPAATALKALNDGRPAQQAIIDNPASTPEQRTAATAEITRLENAANTAKARADSYPPGRSRTAGARDVRPAPRRRRGRRAAARA